MKVTWTNQLSAVTRRTNIEELDIIFQKGMNPEGGGDIVKADTFSQSSDSETDVDCEVSRVSRQNR